MVKKKIKNHENYNNLLKRYKLHVFHEYSLKCWPTEIGSEEKRILDSSCISSIKMDSILRTQLDLRYMREKESQRREKSEQELISVFIRMHVRFFD